MTGRLATIDLLRGVAILLVIHHHIWGGFTPASWLVDRPPYLAVLANGAYGVNLFFLLSGFVLFLPYVQAEARAVRWDEVARFYRRRGRRLLPLYYVSVAVAFLLQVGWSGPSKGALEELAFVATFLFQFSEGHFFPRLNPVLWSLGIEVAFSLLLPFLAVACLRIGMLRAVLAAVALAMLTRWIGTAWSPSLSLTNSVLGRLDDFVVGMAAAWTFVHWPPARRPWLWIASGLVTIQLACMASDAWILRHEWLRAVLVPDALSVGAFALLRGMLAPTLATPWRGIQLIGRMSYSLYLWHVVVRDQMFPLVGVRSPGRLALYFVLLFGFSALTYRFVEFRHERDWRTLFRIPRASPALGSR